jgi:DNA polymerase-3 subunit delta'
MAFSETEAFALLKRAHGHDRLAHAYLITGPQGSGKQRLAQRLCGLVLGLPDDSEGALDDPDVHVARPESRSRRIVVSQVRSLEHELQMRPTGRGRKVAVIFDADRLMQEASNAFLKTLEEPPKNSLLILCTAQPEMLLETIISRCIPVQLRASLTGTRNEGQRELLEAVCRYSEVKSPGIPDAYLMVAEFSRVLQSAKAAIQEHHAAELKREEDLYKQRTEGKWFEDRENYYKALTEAHYIATRFTFVETLIQWWADILRQQNRVEWLDLPEYAPATGRAAESLDTAAVLRKISALEDLRDHLGRNVQEQLAIEAAFLEVFASAGQGSVG